MSFFSQILTFQWDLISPYLVYTPYRGSTPNNIIKQNCQRQFLSSVPLLYLPVFTLVFRTVTVLLLLLSCTTIFIITSLMNLRIHCLIPLLQQCIMHDTYILSIFLMQVNMYLKFFIPLICKQSSSLLSSVFSIF